MFLDNDASKSPEANLQHNLLDFGNESCENMAVLASILASFPILLLSCISLSCVNGTIYREFLRFGQSVRISDTIVSYGGNFELGFFNRTRDNSTKYYVGIRFKKVPNDRIVWVANRDHHAFETSSAALTIHTDGNIVITDGQMIYWVNNVSNNYSTYATLLDSGNLILLNNLDEKILWQSFDHPTDTLLPGMSLGLGDTSLRSWTSVDDPAPGPFSLEYNSSSGSVSLLVNNGSNVLWIDSSYNLSVEGVFNRMGFKTDDYEAYYTLPADSYSRLVLEVSGDLNHQFWSEDAKRWVSVESSKCGTNNTCGIFAICNPYDLDPCGCLKGFEPVDSISNSWRTLNRSAGCVRKKELSCNNISKNNNDGFLQINKVELPLLYEVKVKMDTSRRCESTCIRNCSCNAYAYDFNGFCMLWHDQVLSLKNVSTDNYDGNNTLPSFHLRLAASELDTTDLNISNAYDRHGNRKRNLLLIVILIPFLILLVLLSLSLVVRQRRKGMSMKVKHSEFTEADKVKKKEVKLPLFSFVSVSAATNNFSDANKLGEGGFGPVYKGKLLNGDEVAVKRLSRRSGQGWEELRNEALLIAKLQHNNLVGLLGCCIERDEKMLVYEFMPNKSLDCFLFEPTKRRMLDWGTRVRIIDGITQGLLYLHQYSRFRIIHRDLKASNILLDINMNPKISDFGMARIFGQNELQANTNRIVGTYGYMSPEYAMEGLFSVKSDVFSLGVLLLEIVSGKKNTGFYQTNSFNLLGYAWDLWTNNSGMELMDPELDDTCSKHLVSRYVNIGLLCVQESPADRPTMSDVVSMIGNDTAALPYPKPPAFLNVRGNENSRFARTIEENFSVNVITHSLLEAR